MRQLLLFMMLAGITLHASFGCGLFHEHSHEIEHCGGEVEAAHEHDCHEEFGHHDPDLAPSSMPCGAPASPHGDCDEERCVFAGAVRICFTDTFFAQENVLPGSCSPSVPRVTLVQRFESAAIGRSPPIRSHLLLGVLLL